MKNYLLSLAVLFLFQTGFCQKKPLDHTVYNSWQSIGEQLISNDGKWVVYTIDVQEGDNELVIQSARENYRKTIARGYNARITADSRFLIFSIKPFYRDIRAARIKKAKPPEIPVDSMGILELGHEEIQRTARINSFKIPSQGAGWVAALAEKPAGTKDKINPDQKKITDSLLTVIDSLKQAVENLQKSKKGRNRDPAADPGDDADDDANAAASGTGSDLKLKNPATGEEEIFPNTTEYYFSKDGSKLLVKISADPKDSLRKAAVLLRDLTNGHTDTISRGGYDFRNFAMTEEGSRLAFVAERTAKPKDLQKFYGLWYFTTGMDSAVLLADKNSVGMKLGMTISENAAINFSKNGNRLFFGTAPIQPPKDTSLVETELVKLDLWHYNDGYLQPRQLKDLQEDLKESFLAVYDFDNNRIHQLGSRELPDIIQTAEGEGDTFIGVTDYNRRIESQWTGRAKIDIYAVDVNSGEKKIIRENLDGNVYPSSTGKYIMWYDRALKNYFAWDGETTRNISQKIKTPLYNEENDVPDLPAPYGILGWSKEDSVVLLYDRYDIWKVDPRADKNPQNMLNAGSGRKKKIRTRFLTVDPEKKYIDLSTPVPVERFNEITKQAQYSFYPGGDLVQNFQNYQFGPLKKARDKNTGIYTKENFNSPPDLYVTSDTGANTGCHDCGLVVAERKLSSINPQQQQYRWGSVELFRWKAYNGKLATGLVYKPEGFDPAKKYPLICYFYEKLSENLFKYHPPAPIRSAVNISFYTSRGYLLFIPDIEYKTGHPGKSAYDYVVSGALALVKKGWADASNMAIQGHSWGGYQVAQLITMTSIFKAAWAGAPVANMTSAYGGIRWESGMNRQFQYEKGQSRIGATLWEKPALYIENSPLFHLDKIRTPLVIMHNDNDGAVPWYQGIELFTGMRRLHKKVWMFNYNGEGHGLTNRHDKLDYQVRMQQFFDWILKGEKPAKWITGGLPAVKKGKEWGLELDPEETNR